MTFTDTSNVPPHRRQRRQRRGPAGSPRGNDRRAGGRQVHVEGHQRWIHGTHSRTTIDDFFGVGAPQAPQHGLHTRNRPPGDLRRPRTTA